MLKTWERNAQKEYKINIIKSKDLNLGAVRILAEVIKSLLDKHISGEGWAQLKSDYTNPCKGCDKLFSSERYIKSHATKIHRGPKTCDKCSKKFTTEKAMKSHDIICHLSKNMKKHPEPEDKNRQAGPNLKTNTGGLGIKRKKQTETKNLEEQADSKENVETNESEKPDITHCTKCSLKFSSDIEVRKHIKFGH